MNEIEEKIARYRDHWQSRGQLQDLVDLLLAERDSLERVVSAPEARATTSAAEADLAPVSAPGARGDATSQASAIVKSIYAGQTWQAFRPGEDANFKDAWVSRTQQGHMCSVTNSKKDLEANATFCGVRLKWKPKGRGRPSTRGSAGRAEPAR